MAVTTPDAPASDPVVSEAPQPPVRPWWRARLALICLGLSVLAFMQDPGKIAADTKLDLSVNPGGLMTRALHLWDNFGFSGQLQNQGYGYLWPMGPFFWVGEHLGIPAWVCQRLWWSMLLCLAFLGIMKLAALLGIGTPGARIIGAVAFALSPRVVSIMGAVSSEVWPLALAPWVLIPLVKGSITGSVRKYAALSGLVFLCVGAVNAVGTVAALPLAAWWLITRQKTARMWRLTGWWVVCIALASLWWLLPLVFLGKYSPPFLDWIESAGITTSVTTPVNVMKGVDAWLPYLATATGPAIASGWSLVATWWGVLGTAAVMALGAVGLALKGLPHRVFLVGGALLGFAIISLGHVGVPAGFGSAEVQTLMDGVLSPLRNIHKFDVVLRLPMALGLIYAATRAFAWAGQRQWGRVKVRPLVAGVLVGAVVLGGMPMFLGQLTRHRSADSVPGFWKDAADYLKEQTPGRALIVPASSFGIYQWGHTNDEPMQAFGEVPWNVRDSVPLSSAGNIRLLDNIKEQLDSGHGSATLADALWRAGFNYIVVRNDLDGARTQTPYKTLTHAALADSPGIDRVATFGPALMTFQTSDVTFDEGLDGSYKAVEVFKVTPSFAAEGSAGNSPNVSLRDASSPVLVSGGAEAIPTMPGVTGDRTIVVAGDPGVTDLPPGQLVATDTLRRREVNFGAVRNNTSNTLTAADQFVANRPVHDYTPDPARPPVVAAYSGISGFSASSSGSQYNAPRNRSAANQPWAAIDGDPETAWMTGSYAPGLGQWWQVDFEKPRELPATATVELRPATEGAARPTQVTVTTDGGTVSSAVAPTDAPVTVAIPPGPTSSLRITETAAQPGEEDLGFGIANLDLAGVVGQRTLVVDDQNADGWVFRASSGAKAGCVNTPVRVICSEKLAARGEEDPGIDRTITVTKPGRYDVRVSASPRDTGALDPYLKNPLSPVAISTSSSLTGDPATRADALMDGDSRTSWIAGGDDEDPTITAKFKQPTTISGLKISNRSDLNASSPLGLTVSGGGQPVTAYVNEKGEAKFDPITTDTLTIGFGATVPKRTLSRNGDPERSLPVGITELALIGAPATSVALAGDQQMTLPCGQGPAVSIDGRPAVQTSMSERVDDVLAGRPATAVPCGATGGSVQLDAGTHRVVVDATETYRPVGLEILPADGSLATATTATAAAQLNAPGTPTVDNWGPANRVVSVSAAGTPRTLELAENFNIGWRATLDGQELKPVRVDGWRQAWIVPAGAAGAVDMTFAPDAGYRIGLVLGLLAALALVALALIRARPTRLAPVGAWQPRWLLPALAGIVVAANMGAPGLLLGAIIGGAIVMVRRPGVGAAIVAIAATLSTVLQLIYRWPASATQPTWVTVVQTLAVAAVLTAWGFASLGGTRRSKAAPPPPN